MQIDKPTAAHHELPCGAARLQRAKIMQETALITVDLVRETTLQSLARMIQSLLHLADSVQQLPRERARATIDTPLKIAKIWHNQFCGSTRSRRAQVSDKIADGEIDFMANCRDNWHSRMKYCSCDNFFVELPQVLDAAATARDHDQIEGGLFRVAHVFNLRTQLTKLRHIYFCKFANGHGDFLGCACSLNAHWVNQNLQPRRAPTQHIQYIADRCTARGGDESDSPRQFR